MADNKALNKAEIIAALRCCGNTDTKRPDCGHCPLNGYMCVKRMLEGAADLLERDEPPNNPLTLEELRNRTKPVWSAVPGFSWIPDGGYYCLCEKGLITPPSKITFRAEECLENGWNFFDHPPERGGE